jgi:hypothetical protein
MKASTREDLERAEKLPEKIESHPLTAKVREDEAAVILAKRQEAAARLEALREDEAIIPKLRAAVDEVKAEVKAHDEARKAIEKRLTLATLTLSQERHRIETEARAATTELLSSYDPTIDAAIQFFRDKLDDLRRPGRISYIKMGAVRNVVTWTKTAKQENNEAAVLTALRYCQGAIADLERMRLEPALDAAKLEQLKAGIPPTDIFTETEIEANLPSAVGPQPDFGAGRLMERVNRLLRR